jgi:hypothetical protein
MNEKNKALGWLRNTLNSLAQNGVSKVRKKDLSQHLEFGYSSTDSQRSLKVKLSWDEIVDELKKLEKSGVLSVLKEPHMAGEDEVCARLNTFVSGTPFPSGWVRD